MSWELVLSEDDYRLFKSNISLLEERVLQNFPESYQNPAILSAIRSVPRHLFVNPGYKFLAYTDNALPTSGSLTTSAPSVPQLQEVRHLASQLSKAGGRLVVPVGDRLDQELQTIERRGGRVRCSALAGVSFQFLRLIPEG
jgi:protein-L-isoaspartate O-methyltransferase